MNFRSPLLSGVVFFAAFARASAVNAPSDIPPGPQVTSPSTNPAPETPAPPQANAKSAPGASSPNGTNGLTLRGKPITKAPNTPKIAKRNPAAAPAPAPAVAATPPPKAPISLLDAYVKDLTDVLKLTPEEKKDITTYYLEDGVLLDKILNSETLSPLRQSQEVAALRNARDAKIEALLQDVDRQHEFLRIESRYRVALTELAANGGLIPAQTLAPVPAPTETTPGQAEPIPRLNAPTD